MGNCLEISESDIQRAKQAKLRKMAQQGFYPKGGHPFMYARQPSPVFLATNGQGFIVASPGPPHVVVDPRTGFPYVLRPSGVSRFAHRAHSMQLFGRSDGSIVGKQSKRGTMRSSRSEPIEKEAVMDFDDGVVAHGVDSVIIRPEVAHDPKTGTIVYQNGGPEYTVLTGVMDFADEGDVILDFLDPPPPSHDSAPLSSSTINKKPSNIVLAGDPNHHSPDVTSSEMTIEKTETNEKNNNIDFSQKNSKRSSASVFIVNRGISPTVNFTDENDNTNDNKDSCDKIDTGYSQISDGHGRNEANMQNS